MVERIAATPEYMESERISHFGDLKSSAKAFIDTLIPGYERDLYNIIGRGVVEDKELQPPINDNRHFNLDMIKAEPGKGASPHIHATNEVFFALSGKWAIYWQNQDCSQHEVILEQYDRFRCRSASAADFVTPAMTPPICWRSSAAPIRAK